MKCLFYSHATDQNYSCFVGPVHNKPEEFENAVLLFSVRPSIHTNPSQKRTVSKTFLKPEKMKTPALRFSVDGKYFEKDTFLKRWAYDRHDISLRELFLNTNPKWPVIICSVFQFLQRNLDGTHLIHFPSEASVFKIIQRGVGGP